MDTPFPEPRPRPDPARPGVGTALIFFVLLALLFVTVGGMIQLANIPFGLILTEVFFFFAPAWLAAQAWSTRPTEYLRFRKVTPGLLALGFAIGLANYPLAGAMEAFVRGLAPNLAKHFDASLIFSSVTGWQKIVVVAAVALAAPLCEETMFRGLLDRTIGRTVGRMGAIGITAFLFSAIHLDPIGLLARIELGVLFGVLVLWTGSIWTSIAAHAANNLLATVLFLVVGTSKQASEAQPSYLQLALLAWLGIALATPLLYGMKRMAKPAAEVPDALPIAPALGGPILRWFGMGVLAVGLTLGLGWRGVTLNFADAFFSASGFKDRLDPPQAPAFKSALEALREGARDGKVPASGYRALRVWMSHHATGAPLTAEQTRTLIALVQRWRTTPVDPAELEKVEETPPPGQSAR